MDEVPSPLEFLLSFSMEEWVGHACYALGIEQPTYALAETRVINGAECFRYDAWLTSTLNGQTATASGSFTPNATHARQDVACMLLNRMVAITGMTIKDFNYHKVNSLEEQVANLEAKVKTLETQKNWLTTEVGELTMRLKFHGQN